VEPAPIVLFAASACRTSKSRPGCGSGAHLQG